MGIILIIVAGLIVIGLISKVIGVLKNIATILLGLGVICLVGWLLFLALPFIWAAICTVFLWLLAILKWGGIVAVAIGLVALVVLLFLPHKK